MKKTMCVMTVLAAMASASMGAELIAEWSDFTSLSSTVKDQTYTIVTSGSTSVSDGVLNVVGASNGSATVDLSGNTISASDGLTINMTVSNVTNCRGTWPHGFVGLSATNDDYYMLWGTSANYDTLKAAYNGSATRITTSDTKVDFSAITGDEPVTLTMTFSKSDGLAIYVNGELGATATGTIADRDFKTLALGSWAGASNNGLLSESVHSLSLYKGAMSAQEVKELVVPEPATATLSLLALAGLAARRRRH